MRKLVGGGMRQIGVLAAAGIHALNHHVDRLEDDHANALRLAERLAQVKAIHVEPDLVETNMVFIGLPDGAADGLRKYLAERGILLGGGSKQIRLVTHLDITRDDVDLLSEEISQYFA